jgi:hypothetical protein
MIRHIVLFQLASTDAAERRAQIDAARAALVRLVGIVPGLRRLDVHANALDDARNADFVIDADFDDLAAVEAYAVHPEHVKAADYIATIRKDGSRAAIDFQV